MNRFCLISGLSAVLALGEPSLADEAGIHQCKDATGEIVYQDEPCVEPPPAPAKPAAKTSPKSQPKPAKVVQVEKPAKKPKAEKMPQTRPPEKSWVVVPSSTKRHIEPAPNGRSNDGRMASPEKTLQTFVGAV